MQACNPPDTYWALARLWRLGGVNFVFDHHDLNPELFLSRFGRPETLIRKLEFAGLKWLERMTFRTAAKVISTNESYRSVAMERGGLDPREVTVVRSGPDTRQMRPVYPTLAQARDRKFTLAYLGIMGPQDGVDVVLEVMDELVHRRRAATTCAAALMGFGDCLEELRAQCTGSGSGRLRHLHRAGRQGDDRRSPRAADVGLCPDLKTPLNDVSTMNKTMEYMAYALPSVSFDLVETEVSGADSVLYVESGDVRAFADAVERLLDDPELRVSMAKSARRRVSEKLDWRPQAAAYLGVYAALTDGGTGHNGPAADPEPSAVDHRGRTFVPLDDEVELERFIRDRGPR